MRAVKGNKEYTIDEGQQKFYQDSGFDILGDDGQTVAYGRGKTVPYDQYMKMVKELAELKVQQEADESEKREEKGPEKRAQKKAGE